MTPTTLIVQLVLDGEDIVERTVVVVGPDVGAGSGVDQLSRDTNAVPGSPDTAFEHVAHAQLTADLFHVNRLAPVGEARVKATTNIHLIRARPVMMSSTVGEVVLLRIAAQIGERQHRDRPAREPYVGIDFSDEMAGYAKPS